MTLAGCLSSPNDDDECSTGNWTTCDPGSPPQWVVDAEEAVHAEMNEIRTDAGLDPLDHHDMLRAVSRAHSADMDERDFFDHTNPDDDGPFDRVSDAGVSCDAAGENIAFNYNSDGSAETAAESAVCQWMTSHGHRENILRQRWTSHGIGIVIADDGRVYYTQTLGDTCE